MNKLSIYEHSIKDIKAAFFDIISYEEKQANSEKLNLLKTKMNDLLEILNNEIEEDSNQAELNTTVEKEKSIQENNIVPIDFNTPVNKEEIKQGNVEDEKVIATKEIKKPEVEEKEQDEEITTLTKIDRKNAKAILVVEKQINKLRASREVKKEEIKKVIKENKKFMQSIFIQEDDDTEKKVKELEEQVKKYYEENNFEMAEKILNQIKELSN